MRTCVGCRRTRPIDELVRVARNADGSLVVDRHRPGRGAWLCRRSPACVDLAIRKRAFDRAFRAPVDPGHVDRHLLVARLSPAGRAGWGSEGSAL